MKRYNLIVQRYAIETRCSYWIVHVCVWYNLVKWWTLCYNCDQNEKQKQRTITNPLKSVWLFCSNQTCHLLSCHLLRSEGAKCSTVVLSQQETAGLTPTGIEINSSLHDNDYKNTNWICIIVNRQSAWRSRVLLCALDTLKARIGSKPCGPDWISVTVTVALCMFMFWLSG